MAMILVTIAFIFVTVETIYFGFNINPESIAEAMCDGIAGGLTLAAILCAIWGV